MICIAAINDKNISLLPIVIEHLDILFITASASTGNQQHYVAVIPISILAYKTTYPSNKATCFIWDWNFVNIF
jgi:hypothetical protein